MKTLKKTGVIALLAGLASLILATPALAQTDVTTTSSDATGAALGIGMIICWILAVVVGLAIYIWVAVWIYRDASKRDTSAALWVILWIFFSWVGLIIYLIVRPKEYLSGTAGGTPPPPPAATTETPPPPPSEPGTGE